MSDPAFRTTISDLPAAWVFKSCPFCRRVETVSPVTYGGKPSFSVTCMPGLGGCGGSTGLYEKSDEARKVWNAR